MDEAPPELPEEPELGLAEEPELGLAEDPELGLAEDPEELGVADEPEAPLELSLLPELEDLSLDFLSFSFFLSSEADGEELDEDDGEADEPEDDDEGVLEPLPMLPEDDD